MIMTMKRILLFLIVILFYSCRNDISEQERLKQQDGKGLDKEEKAIKLYEKRVVPLYKDFKGLELPSSIRIDEDDLEVNAGAAHGYVEISRGLINLDNEAIQIFVFSHELAHIATLVQARNFGVQDEIPGGAETNAYKKAEYLADLMAIHLIRKKMPKEFGSLKRDFDQLEGILGSSRFTHPSGKERMQAISTYLEGAQKGQDSSFFRHRFLQIWEKT